MTEEDNILTIGGINPLYIIIGAIVAYLVWQHFKKPGRMEKKDVRIVSDEIDKKIIEKKPYIDINRIPKEWRIYGGIGSIIIIAYGLNKWSTQKLGLIILGLWFILYIISSEPEEPTQKMLTWQECRIKLWDALRQCQLQPLGSYRSIDPNIEIQIGIKNKLQWRDKKPHCRYFLFALKKGKRAKYYLGGIEPFTGQFMGVQDTLTEWHGFEVVERERPVLDKETKDELRKLRAEKKAGL